MRLLGCMPGGTRGGMPRPRHRSPLRTACLALAWLTASASGGTELVLSPEASLLAVVTHRGGPAARLAHDHLVVAGDYRAGASFSPQDPSAARVAVEVPVGALVADDRALEERWFPRFRELGVLADPFKEASESDRAKIREAMLSAKQLDAERHPAISGRLTAVREQAARVGSVPFTHVATVELTVHGRTVSRDLAARFEEGEAGSVLLEAIGVLRFTDFGIEPYSAALGAVRNQDEFHLYVRLGGRPAER